MDAGLGDYPLVLHGASSVPQDLVEEINKFGGKLGTDAAGVPEADIEVARRVGCTKVNIDHRPASGDDGGNPQSSRRESEGI